MPVSCVSVCQCPVSLYASVLCLCMPVSCAASITARKQKLCLQFLFVPFHPFSSVRSDYSIFLTKMLGIFLIIAIMQLWEKYEIFSVRSEHRCHDVIASIVFEKYEIFLKNIEKYEIFLVRSEHRCHDVIASICFFRVFNFIQFYVYASDFIYVFVYISGYRCHDDD